MMKEYEMVKQQNSKVTGSALNKVDESLSERTHSEQGERPQQALPPGFQSNQQRHGLVPALNTGAVDQYQLADAELQYYT